MQHLRLFLSTNRVIEWLEDEPKPGDMNIRDSNVRGPGTCWPLQAAHMKIFNEMAPCEVRHANGVIYMKDEL